MTRARDTANTQENIGGPVAPFAAGKNKIINGDFGVWQRGTSFSNPTTEAFTADRWQLQHDGTGATRTISQQTFTPGTAPVAGYEGQYFYRYAISAAGTSNTFQQFLQKIEDVRTFAGQTITLSFWAKADASRLLTLLYRTDYGTGGTAPNQFSVGSVTLTTSWTRYTVTYAVPSVSGLTLGANSYGQWNFRPPAATVQTIDIWGVQIEAGSVATPFTPAGGGFPGAELALCQRYYYRTGSQSNGNPVYTQFGVGYAINTGAIAVAINLPVSMRVAPTVLDTSAMNTFYWEGGGVGNTPNSIAIGGSNQNNLGQVVVSKTSSFTTNATYWFFTNGVSTGFLGFSAEL